LSAVQPESKAPSIALTKGSISLCFKAVSQLLWSRKGREEWFSLGENHERRRGFGLHQLRNRYSRRFIDPSRACTNSVLPNGRPVCVH
jgi:hypothetical protein